VRHGDWKYIHFYEDNHGELYNLKDDPQESQDLTDRFPQKAAQLRAVLEKWLKEVDAQLPTPNPDYQPE